MISIKLVMHLIFHLMVMRVFYLINNKGARVYKGTSIEDAKTWMGYAKNDFIDIKIRNSDKSQFYYSQYARKFGHESNFSKKD